METMGIELEDINTQISELENQKSLLEQDNPRIKPFIKNARQDLSDWVKLLNYLRYCRDNLQASDLETMMRIDSPNTKAQNRSLYHKLSSFCARTSEEHFERTALYLLQSAHNFEKPGIRKMIQLIEENQLFVKTQPNHVEQGSSPATDNRHTPVVQHYAEA